MKFSPRESEIMGCLFEMETASAREVWSALGESCTYSTIRKILSILEQKGYVSHRKKERTYIYTPSIVQEDAASSMLSRLLKNFFKGSVESAVSSLLGERGKNVSSEELERIAAIIEAAKKE